MSQTIPKTMKAQVLQASKTIKVEEVPVPAVEDDQILVRVAAVALNPTDWKHIEYLTVPGTICGCEFTGHVVQVGKGVTKFSVGDLIAGLTHGSAYTDKGAFAEYAIAFEDLAWKVPDNITAEEAATMNVGPLTVLQSFYHPTALAIPTLPAKIEQEQWILIYGGSSSVGLFAIQLAKLSGFKVVTTASPRNFDLLTSLGADALFDYRDTEVISKIKAVTSDSLHLALDCISTPESETLTLKTFAPGPGKLHVLTFLQSEDIRKIREDVSISVSLLYTANGVAFTIAGHHIPASPENRKQVADWLAGPWIPLVKEGLVKPNPVKLMPGGLEGIAEGLEYMKAGKNSAEKLVYKI